MAFEGEKGFVISVKDSGQGFDFREAIAKANLFLERGNRDRSRAWDVQPSEKYFKRWGSAFWVYMVYPVDVSFEDAGSRTNMLFRC